MGATELLKKFIKMSSSTETQRVRNATEEERGGRRGTGHGSHVANSRDQKAPYTHTHANSNGELTMNGKGKIQPQNQPGGPCCGVAPRAGAGTGTGTPCQAWGRPEGRKTGRLLKNWSHPRGCDGQGAVGVMGGGLLHDPLPPKNLVEGTRPQRGQSASCRTAPPGLHGDLGVPVRGWGLDLGVRARPRGVED